MSNPTPPSGGSGVTPPEGVDPQGAGLMDLLVKYQRQALTAMARAEKAEAAVARVRNLHRAGGPGFAYCIKCAVRHPCTTMRALDGETP